MKLSYGRMLFFVQSVVRSMRLTRQRNLALLALGIARVRDGHLTMSEIARVIPTSYDHWYKFKRIKRFLANPRWSPDAHFDELVAFVTTRFRTGRYLPIIIDQSTIRGRWEVVWASIPFRGRALPIDFHLFRDLKDQLHLETIRLQHPDRVARLLFGMIILYYALTLLGAEAHRRGLRKKVCKDRINLVWPALRLLAMPLLLRDTLVHAALYLSSWSLLCESG